MEGELAEFDGLEIVHDGENAFLHFSGVLGAKDDHLHALEVDLDGGGGTHTLGETVGRKLAGIVDDKVGLAKGLEFVLGRADEHVVHEEGMVGAGADNANFDPVSGIPASVAVEDVYEFAGVEIVDGTLAIDFEGVWRRLSGKRGNVRQLTLVHLNVDGAPPDGVLAGLLKDDALVLWTSAGLLARKVDEGTRRGDDGAFVPNGIFIELGRRGIAFQVYLFHVKASLREMLEVAAEDWRGMSKW